MSINKNFSTFTIALIVFTIFYMFSFIKFFNFNKFQIDSADKRLNDNKHVLLKLNPGEKLYLEVVVNEKNSRDVNIDIQDKNTITNTTFNHSRITSRCL